MPPFIWIRYRETITSSKEVEQLKNQMHKNKGFSLIELLVAMAILSIIMIMVVQFMSTSSGAMSKNKRNLNLQTEAMEVGEQFSDAIIQATYIRVCTQDEKLYELNNELEAVGSSGKKKKKRTAVYKGAIGNNELIVDNYPNYFLAAGAAQERIILDTTTAANKYKLVKEDGTPYSDARSFRLLTSGGSEPFYVKPKYIYLQYQKKVNGGAEAPAYVIYRFEGNRIYMFRGDVDTTVNNDGYNTAVANVTSADCPILTEAVAIDGSYPDCYLSANTKKNTVALDILFQDTRYNQYTYNYVESIQLCNSNVLTVAPNKMYQYKPGP